MNIPKIQSDTIWSVMALFLLLSIGYWTILYMLRKYKALRGNQGKEKRKQLEGILSRLIHYYQDKLKISERELLELKVELWKLLRKSSNKRMASKIIGEMNTYLDKGGEQIAQRLSKEFGLQFEFMDNIDQPGAAQIYKTKNVAPLYGTDNFNAEADLLKGEQLDLDFVPIVTNNGNTHDGRSWELQEETMLGYDLEFSLDSLDWESFEKNPYEAIREEIYGKNKIYPSHGMPKTEASFLNIDFLPEILEDEDEKKEGLTNLNDIEVEYEVVLDPYFKKQISDILKTHQKEENGTAAPNGGNNILDLGEMKLPAAKFYTDSEFKKVKLLHSIAEMGDMREIPLLNEMLEVEENESIGNLIKEIIFKFLYHCPMDIEEENNDEGIIDFGEHYVFNHLFSSLDIESQLLLLEEIQGIGDISDLYFLKTLHNHSNKAIGEKAKWVSESIEAKFQAIINGSTPIISGDNRNSNKEISRPPNLFKDLWITFDVAKSGFITTTSSRHKKNRETNGMAPMANFDICPGDVKDNMDYNEDLFRIDFDITSMEHVKGYHGNSHEKGKSARNPEEMKFLDRLKVLIKKLFKK